MHMPRFFPLDAWSFEKVLVLDELFHRVTPVRSTLKSVDGLGALTKKDQISGARFLHYIQFACHCVMHDVYRSHMRMICDIGTHGS
jgi:hypothetical protein